MLVCNSECNFQKSNHTLDLAGIVNQKFRVTAIGPRHPSKCVPLLILNELCGEYMWQISMVNFFSNLYS